MKRWWKNNNNLFDDDDNMKFCNKRELLKIKWGNLQWCLMATLVAIWWPPYLFEWMNEWMCLFLRVNERERERQIHLYYYLSLLLFLLALICFCLWIFDKRKKSNGFIHFLVERKAIFAVKIGKFIFIHFLYFSALKKIEKTHLNI